VSSSRFARGNVLAYARHSARREPSRAEPDRTEALSEDRGTLRELAEITNLPRGAKFYRADMHIHSYRASHDVRDAGMTAEAIVKTALAQGLGAIAITDHNEISNVSAALKAADRTGLLVVPGVELSTPTGTSARLCADPRRAAAVLRAARHCRPRRTQLAVPKQHSRLFDPVHALGGFGILAHVDAEKGFETENPGASPHKVDVICHSALLGIELRSSASAISYADIDPDGDRARAGRAASSTWGWAQSSFSRGCFFRIRTPSVRSAATRRATRR
jgi:hypothetical protein